MCKLFFREKCPLLRRPFFYLKKVRENDTKKSNWTHEKHCSTIIRRTNIVRDNGKYEPEKGRVYTRWLVDIRSNRLCNLPTRWKYFNFRLEDIQPFDESWTYQRKSVIPGDLFRFLNQVNRLYNLLSNRHEICTHTNWEWSTVNIIVQAKCRTRWGIVMYPTSTMISPSLSKLCDTMGTKKKEWKCALNQDECEI